MNKITLRLSCLILLSNFLSYSSQNGLGFVPNTHFSSVDPETGEAHTDEEENIFFKTVHKILQQLKKNQYRYNKKNGIKQKKFRSKELNIQRKLSSKDRIVLIIGFASNNISNLPGLIETAGIDILNEKITIQSLYSVLQQTRANIKEQFVTTLNLYKTDATNNELLKDMMLLINALYIKSNTLEEIGDNKKLGRLLYPYFHPDKTHEEHESLKTQFFIQSNPLLTDNKKSPYLNKILENINKNIANTFWGNNSSATESILYNLAQSTIPTLSYITAYHATSRLLPNKTIESKLADRCKNAQKIVHLNIENLSLNIKAKLLQELSVLN